MASRAETAAGAGKEPWSILRVLEWTSGYFRERGIDSPRLDAELLLAATLELERIGLYLRHDQPLSDAELGAFREKVARRARREPLQYILGHTEFWSLPLKVGAAVLVPRADTEVLVEEALACVPGARAILDVGTGSGAIAIALAHELPEARVLALDISPRALALAADNAALNGVAGRIRFCEGDLATLPAERFELIVANPPYIPTAQLAELMPEVRDYEPRLALDGGADGLDAYRALAHQAIEHLEPGGWMLVEIGAGQQDTVGELFIQAGLGEIRTRADYAGIIRVVGARRPLVPGE